MPKQYKVGGCLVAAPARSRSSCLATEAAMACPAATAGLQAPDGVEETNELLLLVQVACCSQYLYITLLPPPPLLLLLLIEVSRLLPLVQVAFCGQYLYITLLLLLLCRPLMVCGGD
jgi:hypothetical protein